MSDKIKILIQKRTSLKSQITSLNNTLDKGNFDNTALRLRMTRLTELYHAYEEFNDELMVLDTNENHETEFTNIQERYYSLAGRIENLLNAMNVSGAISVNSSGENRIEDEQIPVLKKRRIKLPEAALPIFDGKYENWLSFKNAFRNMVGSQTDLSDIDKLHYLKTALIGEAANKIRIFEIDGINYSKAWNILERSYEVKRILISRHLLLILNLSVLDKETSNGLSKLADDAQQHVASLNSLGVSIGPEMIVHILESKLPKFTLEKWEATLERDEFPTPDQMYEFLYKTAVCTSKRERLKITEIDRSKLESSFKRKRNNYSSHA